MHPSFRAKKKKGDTKKGTTETKEPIATWDASGTSVGETGAVEGVKKGTVGKRRETRTRKKHRRNV